MQTVRSFFHGIALAVAAMTSSAVIAATPVPAPSVPLANLPIGVINFKECIEKSRLGKQEQASFETMKRQMDGALQEKQKVLIDKQKVYQETKAKWDDLDYRDSLSPEAEAELKHKLRMLEQELGSQGQELAQQEEQCYQILGQKNMTSVQKLQELMEKAAEIVAKQEGLLMLVNQEAFFYYAPQLDKTALVLAQIDKMTPAVQATPGQGALPETKPTNLSPYKP